MSMSDALRTIIAASPNAASEAIACLRAIAVHSPVVQQRYNRCAEIALADPQGQVTAEQRAQIAEHVAIEEEETRTVISLRLTPSERAEIASAADAAGQTVSEYIRSRLFA